MKSFDEWFAEKNDCSFDEMHMQPNYPINTAMRALTVALRGYVTDMVGDKLNRAPLGCMHVNLRTAGTGMVCLECGAYLEFHAG